MAGKGGARPGAGNPGYGKLQFLRRKVEELSPLWFKEIEAMLKSKTDMDAKKFALTELNKLQLKMIPQEITGPEGGPLNVQLIQYASASRSTPQVPAQSVSTSAS